MSIVVSSGSPGLGRFGSCCCLHQQLSYLQSQSKNASVLHQIYWNTMMWHVYFNGDILIGAEIIGQTRAQTSLDKTQHLVILLCISHVSIQISQLFSIYVGAVHSTVALRALVLKQNAHAFVTIHFVFVVSIFENAWCNVVLLLGGFIHSCLIFSLDQKMLSSCINLAEIQCCDRYISVVTHLEMFKQKISYLIGKEYLSITEHRSTRRQRMTPKFAMST